MFVTPSQNININLHSKAPIVVLKRTCVKGVMLF